MRLTIKDIARMAGVSVSAVSKIINNYSDIGEETREKVLSIMEQTGYKPSFSAKSLPSKRTNIIGVVFGNIISYDFNHSYYTEVLNAFKHSIGKLGYDILLFSNEQVHASGEDYLARCLHYRVDGCLVFVSDDVAPAVKSLDESDVPCVGINLRFKGTQSGFVDADNFQIGCLAAAHLSEKGHLDIGFIGSRKGASLYEMREKGWRSVLKDNHIACHKEWIVYGNDMYEKSGYDAMKRMINQSPSLPTAVFAASDLLAIGAIRAIRDSGLKVPEDISIIGCNNIEACQYIDPPLTTVSQNKEKIGAIASELLHQLIIGPEPEMERAVIVEPAIIARGTVKRMDG